MSRFAFLRAALAGVSIALAPMTISITNGGQAAMAGEVPTVEASYVWQSSVDNGDGTYAVTFDVTLTNLGIDDLLDLRIKPVSGALPMRIHENDLVAVDLWFGGTVQLSWTITSYADWPAALAGDENIIAYGEATDAFGENIGVTVISGGAVQ